MNWIETSRKTNQHLTWFSSFLFMHKISHCLALEGGKTQLESVEPVYVWRIVKAMICKEFSTSGRNVKFKYKSWQQYKAFFYCTLQQPNFSQHYDRNNTLKILISSRYECHLKAGKKNSMPRTTANPPKDPNGGEWLFCCCFQKPGVSFALKDGTSTNGLSVMLGVCA